MAFIVLHSPLTSEGIKYSLHHLQPFTVKLDGKGKVAGSDLTVRVSYHCHVYSKVHAVGATGFKFKDEGGKDREFCIDRYNLCVGLPAICADLITQNFPSWESKDVNGKNNMAVSEAAPTSGTKYIVFYELLPSETVGIDVELIVKTAYEKYFDAAGTGKRSKVHALLRTVLYTGTKLPK